MSLIRFTTPALQDDEAGAAADPATGSALGHANAAANPLEILYCTDFGYMFPMPPTPPGDYLIVDNAQTVPALTALGQAMADPGTVADPQAGAFDSTLPAVFTYLGQFIDHDLTARTDRDASGVNDISQPQPPRSQAFVVDKLKNGRRPTLDLDSLYGPGPAFSPNAQTVGDTLHGQGLFRNNLSMRLQRFPASHTVDLPRSAFGGHVATATIADERNDENVVISQLHAAFLAFHNRVRAGLSGTDAERFVRARQLTRWTYQRIVLREYLPAVCEPGVVADVLANGPQWLGAGATRPLFMPLEFSIAAFRFGHSMVRPFYVLNAHGGNQVPRTIDDLFFPGRDANFLNGTTLKPKFRVDWEFFVPNGNHTQMARVIDARLSQGLGNLHFVMGNQVLAVRNLHRAFHLSVPTGQAVAKAMGVTPLTAAELKGPDPADAIHQALSVNDLDTRTPLWFYVLREAEVHQGGARLGEVGSRIVAETIASFVFGDPTSYRNRTEDPAVTPGGIRVGGVVVDTLGDLLRFAGVRP